MQMFVCVFYADWAKFLAMPRLWHFYIFTAYYEYYIDDEHFILLTSHSIVHESCSCMAEKGLVTNVDTITRRMWQEWFKLWRVSEKATRIKAVPLTSNNHFSFSQLSVCRDRDVGKIDRSDWKPKQSYTINTTPTK